jgi:enterochelin esterase family protein
VDFENTQPDPLNPRRIPGREGDLSEVTTPGWKRSTWTKPFAGDTRGRIETLTLESTILGNAREVGVYLPAGYDRGSERYPVVVAVDGQDWRSFGHLPNVLDHLADEASPMIVAFVGRPANPPQQGPPEKSADYARMLAEELVPKLDATYRTVARPDARAVLGAGSGATTAATAAISRPDVFGKAAATSVFLGMGGAELITAVESFDASAGKPVFVISWSRNELRRADWNADLARDSKRLADALEAKGLAVTVREVPDSSGWGAWPIRAGEMLVSLFPEG